jgi:hypothetical protein
MKPASTVRACWVRTNRGEHLMRTKPATTNSSEQLATAGSMIARHGLDKAERLARRFVVETTEWQAREFWVGAG